MDCDRDCLRFQVRQSGSFCHLNTLSCWGELKGLPSLEHIIVDRLKNAPADSYTKRLLEDPTLLAAKLREEAEELIAAKTPEEVTWESADLLYFTLVSMAGAGVQLRDTIRHLEQRQMKVSRRAGNAKAPYLKKEPSVGTHSRYTDQTYVRSQQKASQLTALWQLSTSFQKCERIEQRTTGLHSTV